jgi:DNA-binding MarR family transcriptional regulator
LRTEDIGELGVSVGGVAVLAQLYRAGDRTVGQLATAERVQPPSMTRTVTCLEAEGYVERCPHPTDGRQIVVKLSDRGRDLLSAERRRRDAWLTCRMRELTPEERAVLRSAAPILEKLSNASSNAGGTA